MEKKSKKSIIIGITLLLLVTLTLLGLTYAYYRTRIIGNEANTSVSVTSQILEVVYSDDNATFTATGIAPGYNNESNPKTFTVENTGTEKISYSIKLDNINNEFNRLDWTYELLLEDEIIETGIIPNGASEVYIVNSVEIDTETTQNFKLIIRYANSSEDQSEDMEKGLSFRINIADETGQTFKKYASDGTLLAAIERDNDLAVPLSTPGEEASLTKYKEVAGTSSSKNLTASYQGYYIAYADSYTFNEWKGTFDLVNPQVGKYSEVYSSLEGKYILYIGTISSSTSSSLKKIGGTSVYKITSATTNTTNTFAYDEITREATSASEAVLASAEDDYGDSYYYRGGVENNYVNYSGMCWRIVRVQGNGTIKLTLADSEYECDDSSYSADNENAVIKIEATSYDDLETKLQFTKNWETEVDLDTTQLVTDTNEWCEDSSVYEEIPSEEEVDPDGDGNYEIIIDYNYGAYKRLGLDKSPSLKCAVARQKQIVGQLTADEVLFAGDFEDESYTKIAPKYYLQTNMFKVTSPEDENYDFGYWTLTPSKTTDWYAYFYRYIVLIDGIVTMDSIYGGIRPTIILKSSAPLNTIILGQNGTQGNPYVIN